MPTCPISQDGDKGCALLKGPQEKRVWVAKGQYPAWALLTWTVGPEERPFSNALGASLTLQANSSPTWDHAGPPGTQATVPVGPLSHMLSCLVTQMVPMTKLVISITHPALCPGASFFSFFPSQLPLPFLFHKTYLSFKA